MCVAIHYLVKCQGYPNSVIDWIQVQAVWGLRSGSMNVTFSRRMYVGVFSAVCVSSTDGLSTSTIHDNQPAADVLLQKSSCFQLLLLRHLTLE